MAVAAGTAQHPEGIVREESGCTAPAGACWTSPFFQASRITRRTLERCKDMMVETKRSKAVKSKKIEMDQADKASAGSTLQDDIGELKSTQDEFIAADKYHQKLMPQFIDHGMTWEEVQKALQDVIGSLKEALEILGRQGSVDTSA